MVEITGIPGHSRPSNSPGSSIEFLTTTRSTVLAKLPSALFGGSSANSMPSICRPICILTKTEPPLPGYNGRNSDRITFSKNN